MKKRNSFCVIQIVFIGLACTIILPWSFWAQSPSEVAQHSQAKAALDEEPKFWDDLVGMEFEGGAYPTDAQASWIFDEYDFQLRTTRTEVLHSTLVPNFRMAHLNPISCG